MAWRLRERVKPVAQDLSLDLYGSGGHKMRKDRGAVSLALDVCLSLETALSL